MANKSSMTAAEAIMKFEPLYQGAISRNIRATIDESLTHLQIQALYLLRDTGPLAMHQISSRMHMSKQHLTRFMDAMVKKGLLERFQKENNRRTVFIRITEDGCAALEKYIDYAKGIIAEMLERFSEEEKNQITAHVTNLTDSLSKLTGELE